MLWRLPGKGSFPRFMAGVHEGEWLVSDPGGSKCAVLRLAPDGTARAFAVRRSPGRSGRSRSLIREAVGDVLRETPCSTVFDVVASHGPVQAARLRRQLEAQGFRVRETVGVSETRTALALAGVDHGLVALAGTGAVAGGRTGDGRELLLDGLGPVLGDSGSGFQIGWLAARAAAMAAQHPYYETSLRVRVFAALGVSTLGELIRLSLRSHDRSLIASLAQVADEEARRGDAAAQRIIRAAAADMAALVADMTVILDVRATPCPLVGIGGVIQHSDLYWEHLCRLVAGHAPLLVPARPRHPAVLGLALAGWRQLHPGAGAAAETTFRNRLLATFDALKEGAVPA